MMLSIIILIENFRWLVPTALMMGVAPAYITTWGVWRVISAVLPRWVYVKGDDFLFSLYHRNILFYFEKLTGVEMVFYGDLNAIQSLAKGENCLYLSNHQSTVDWVIASSVSMRRGSLGRTRYVLKDGLKFLPLYGVYLGLHGSLFVKRAGKFNKGTAEKQLKRDARDKKPMWLVVFPEGTRYNPELFGTIRDSKKYAEEQGVQPLESVLYPRARAVQVCVEQMKDSLDAVYDVTIAYGNSYDYKNRHRKTAPTMQDFLLGRCRSVHIHVARIPMKEVPSDPVQLKKWLYARYQAKDRLMQEFYTANSEEEARFPGIREVKPLPLLSLLPSVLVCGGVFALFQVHKADRDAYWAAGLGAMVMGIVWSGIRY